MSEKFCKDCKYRGFTVDGFYMPGYCTRNPRTNLVTGNPQYWRCEDERSVLGQCGKEGSYFEPKPPQVEEPKPKPKRYSVFRWLRGE